MAAARSTSALHRCTPPTAGTAAAAGGAPAPTVRRMRLCDAPPGFFDETARLLAKEWPGGLMQNASKRSSETKDVARRLSTLQRHCQMDFSGNISQF